MGIIDQVKSASILIVDDQEANVHLLLGVLGKHGYTDLRSTTDPGQVVALFGERQPDLILLDLMMPHLNGFEVMEKLGPLTPPGDYLPILVLTADTTPEVKRRALSSGAKDFLSKPLDFGEVALRVRNLLETRLLHLRLQGYNTELEQMVRERTAQVLEREQRQRAILNALPDLMFVQDAEGVFLDYNASDPALLFAPPERFLGKHATEVFSADLAARLEPPRRAALATQQVQAVEYALPMPAGTAYFEARFSAGEDDQTVAIVRDVTPRRRADQLMAALNRVAVEMERALTRDDAFSRLRCELEDLGMTCMMFLSAEDGRVLIPQYLGYPAEVLAVAEKLGGIASEDHWLVVDDSDLYRRVMRERETCFVADVPKDLGQLPPGKLRRFAEAIERALDAPQMICAPVIVGDTAIAALSVRSKQLTAEDVPAVKAFAQQIAAAWHKTELYEQAQQEIVERRRAEDQVRRQLDRLAALHSIDDSISRGSDLGPTLETILVHVMAQLDVDAAAVLLLDPGAMALEPAAWRGFRGRAIERSRQRLGEGPAGRAAQERRLVHFPNLPDIGRVFERAETFAGEDFVACDAAPLVVEGDVVGVLEVFHRAHHEADEEWLSFLMTLAGQAAIAVENARLFEGLQRANADLALAYDSTIEGWAHALDLRDEETEGHSRRVTEMTESLARAMGVGDDEIVHIRRGALLHDIGKMGLPDSILLKPGKLSEAEWASLRRHPQHAYDLLSPIDYLRPALSIPYCHHERWDGTGYPRGLKGEEIPLAARLFAVVDVWDALRADRPYRERWPEEKALDHIRSGSGTHFDPAVVEVFLSVLSETAAQQSTERATA